MAKAFTPRDVYQEVTDRIVASLEAGNIPWVRPWKADKTGSGSEPYNASTGRPYNGINLLILGTMPYADLGWLTYKQAQALGGNVRKGEHGTGIVFWKFERRKDDSTGETRVIPLARMYTVFNIDQCEGIPAAKLKRPEPAVPGATSINDLATKAGARVEHGGNRAFYRPSGDFIRLPSFASFASPQAYDATLAHELTHWTGHESRLKRDYRGRFGDAAYAFEELIAKIGSAFLCTRMGVELTGLQHADYLADWLTVLKNDKRAIFTASSQAKKAAEFLCPSQVNTDDESDTTETTTAQAA